MDVLTLQGVLTLDKSQYDRGLADADKGAHSFGGRFSNAMKVGAVAAAALGAATVVAGKKIVDGAKQVAEYGDHVDKMSQKIGISSESYQKWDYVMKRAGGNVDQLKMGMKTLSQQAEKNSDAFQQLGISQEEVANSSKEELFEKTVKGLSDMEDSTERTALASKLLGRAGADMAPLFNQGSDAIEEQMEIAEKYGMVMPEETVKASAAFQDSMTTLQMTTEGLKNRLLGELLPSMTQVTDGLAKLFTGDMSGLDDIEKGVKNFVGQLGKMIPKVLEVGGRIMLGLIKGIITKLPQIIATGAEMLGKLLEGLQNSLANAAPVIANVVKSIAEFITTNAPLLIQTALQLMVALAQGLLQALPTIIASIPTIISGIVKAFSSFNWGNVGKTVIKGIAKGLRAVGGLLKSAVSKPVNAVKNAVGNGFKAAKEKAVQWMQNLKDGVKEKIEAAKDKVKEVIEKIKALFPFKVGKIFSGWVPKISLKAKKSKEGDKAETEKSVKHERFAKAMNQPYLFTKPTLFNQIAGDAGDEVLYGKSSLMNDITEAMRKGGDKTSGNVIINLNYNAGSDADEMVRDIARGVRRYRMAGAF